MAKHVLVVDDDSTHRVSLQTLLVAEGYHCDIAENGREALAFLKSHTVDIVLTDHSLPIINGIQLIQRIAHHDFPVHPPSILITGELDPSLATKAQQAGAFTTVRKPYDIPALLGTISKALETANGSSGNQPQQSSVIEKERPSLSDQVPQNGSL